MTRYEKIKSMGFDEMVEFLCDLFSEHGGCRRCVARDDCWLGHNGVRDWLEAEVGEDGKEA